MLYLWFRSDNSTARDGFELTWNSINPGFFFQNNLSIKNLKHLHMNTLFSLVVCGGDITFNSHGSISSPGSPGNYPPNRDCIWKLRAPPGKKIHLHFLTMQLEAHETCQYDYLAVRLNEKFLNFCVIESS